MRILTADILKMLRYKVRIQFPSNRKSCVGLKLAFLHLTLTYCKGQCQNVMYILGSDTLKMLIYMVNISIWLRPFDKYEDQGHVHFYSEYLETVE